MARLQNTGQSDILCPPRDNYILRFTHAGDIEEVPAYGEDPNDPNHKTSLRVQFEFKITDFPYDEEEDEEDWNGFEIKNFYNVGKDFNHARSKIGALLKALMQVDYIEVGDDIELEELYGTRIKATVGPNDNGYPRIESPVPYRKRDTSPKPAAGGNRPKRQPEPVEDDDGAELFDDEDVA